jgi:hypothetical protein
MSLIPSVGGGEAELMGSELQKEKQDRLTSLALPTYDTTTRFLQ